MSDDTYNGYPNRETWAAALWQDNDEGMYDRVNEMMANAHHNFTDYDANGEAEPLTDDAKASIRYELASEIEQMWDEITDPQTYDDMGYGKMVPASVLSMITDIGSFYRVDWDFIADSVLSES